MEKTFKVDIHTDGACSCNPGPMGIGIVLVNADTKKEKEISEFIGDGTFSIRMRRKRYSGGSKEIFGRWEGYLE